MDRDAQSRRNGAGRSPGIFDRGQRPARRRGDGPAELYQSSRWRWCRRTFRDDLMARILVAEDDDDVRAFVSRALVHMGHEVTEAEDGGIAAEICAERNGEFDL